MIAVQCMYMSSQLASVRNISHTPAFAMNSKHLGQGLESSVSSNCESKGVLDNGLADVL